MPRSSRPRAWTSTPRSGDARRDEPLREIDGVTLCALPCPRDADQRPSRGRTTRPRSRPVPIADVEVARRAARAAMDVLLELRAGSELTGRALGDAGDAAAQRAILASLTADRPDDLVFSEEAVDDPRRLAADRVWIVDPLDGTRE